MNENLFLEKFREQFDETNPELINYETEFRKLEEWNSMLALCVIALADGEYKVQLSGKDIRNASTVRDLYLVIQSKL